MGYDIESVNGDRAKAAEFAKKYEYTYLFDEKTGEYTGSDNLYFRANIWGMSMIRVILDKIVTLNGGEYPAEFAMATMDNSGNQCTPAGIKEYLAHISMFTGLYPELYENTTDLFNDIRESIKPVVAEYVKETREKDTTYKMENGQLIEVPFTVDDEVNADTNLIIEFLEFSDLCLGLDGYRVF
ncbi:MAG: hypothetical protein EBR82_61260 [Caulobacteraceae bacterium]|nr:hypothetical protein [Caulobacteraceae bacterium]